MLHEGRQKAIATSTNVDGERGVLVQKNLTYQAERRPTYFFTSSAQDYSISQWRSPKASKTKDYLMSLQHLGKCSRALGQF